VTDAVAVDPHADSAHLPAERAEPTIQLLVANDRNRQLLASFLGEWATPVTREAIRDADLYLVDEASLAQHRADLLAHKREHHPVFCPVILLGRDGRRRDDVVVDVDAPGAPVLVDEHLPVPVEKPVLARRLRNLLARRRRTEMLRAKTDRLEQFAGRLSHELRNPLNLLDGYLAIARDQRDPAAFETCRTAIDRMGRMIADTLLLARQGDVEIEPRPVSLSAVVDACWDAVDAPEARLEIDTDRRVSADGDRLHALLANLLRNAVEHGGPGVTVTVGALADGFFVADDGVGIPDAERETVFEDGYTTGPRGTGFGLSVVAEIAAVHGWRVTVTDGEAGGARFEIAGVEFASR
jgi:signal transduction histidine kinase